MFPTNSVSASWHEIGDHPRVADVPAGVRGEFHVVKWCHFHVDLYLVVSLLYTVVSFVYPLHIQNTNGYGWIQSTEDTV